MTTMPRASSHEQSRGSFFIFLVLFSLCSTEAQLSGGQESVLDRGPVPESVQALNSPLDIPFLPLAPTPWAFTTLRDSLRESLKLQMATLPPFFRDTQVGLTLRLYYFNRDNDVTPPR
jgi:hypothetical protein